MSVNKDWPLVPLVSICNPKQWPTIPQSEFTSTGYPVYGANGKIGFYREFNHEKPTVLITCRGATCGTINVCEPKSYVTGNSMALDDLDESRVCVDYLVHALRHSQLSKAISGTAQPQITRQGLSAIAVPLPPLSQQRQIAGVLNKVDALRVMRRATIDQVETLTKSIFLDMFGDPATNSRGWRRLPLSKLLQNIDSGWSPTCLDRPASKDEWGVLKLGAVTWCEYDPAQNKALPKGIDPRTEHEIQPGDLLFSRKNTRELVAACALVRETPRRLLMPDLIFRLRLLPDAPVDSTFLHQLLVYPTKRREVQKLASGSAGSMPNISKARLETLPIEIPPHDRQREFADRVSQINRIKVKYHSSEAGIGDLFGAIQQRGFSGDL